jgi:hypothetical protein
MLDIGYDLRQEKARLGRWPTVREAIVFLIGRDEDAADKLRALGPQWMRSSIYVRGFGKIRNVEPDPSYARWATEAMGDQIGPAICVDAS